MRRKAFTKYFIRVSYRRREEEGFHGNLPVACKCIMGNTDVTTSQTKDGEESVRMNCYAANTRSSSTSSQCRSVRPKQDDDNDNNKTTKYCHYNRCCLLSSGGQVALTPTSNNSPRAVPTTTTTATTTSISTTTPSSTPATAFGSGGGGGGGGGCGGGVPSSSSPSSSPSSPPSTRRRRRRRLCLGRRGGGGPASDPSLGCHSAEGKKEQVPTSANQCYPKKRSAMVRSRSCCCCQCDIVGFAIQCDQCIEIDLCLQCFSLGAEVGPHRRDHSYRILSDMIGPFNIQKPWTLVEETMLLDAVEQYGFGNWHDVANHVETRNASAVSIPCCSDFGLDLPSTEESVSNHKFNNTANNNNESETCSVNHKKVLNNSIKKEEPDCGVVPAEKNHVKRRSLRYVLFRDDFVYDKDAESLISSLSVEIDDEDIDIAFKLSQVDTYRLRLQEREHRKRLARDYGLFQINGGNKFKSQYAKKKTTKLDREFQEKLRVFAKFHTFQEHVQYYESLARERDLKSRIRELFRFRKNGLMTFAEVLVFKNKKYKRDRRKNNNKRLDSRLQEGGESMASGELNENLDLQGKEPGGKYDIFYLIRRKLAAVFCMKHFLKEITGLSLTAASLINHSIT
ncbi:transcriptional adapter 2-beta isoform X2 [Octopus sinensis]|uniref:Transcriptional adapter 2-beta isoform X2 n=1 Tax=Octopus sinensis TaxID=2607531 RepID=A0A7E6EM83_9MOLL|nr:transcriptional adapter 2-beta isoform X2 [Octopus sinensis]